MGCSLSFSAFPRIKLELDPGGLELQLGPLFVLLRWGTLGLVWEGRFDALLEIGGNHWANDFSRQSTEPGWYEFWAPGLYVSLMMRPRLEAQSASSPS